MAAPVAAIVAAAGRVRPERTEVMLPSGRRREHAPEPRARLVSGMMAGLLVPAAAQRLLPVRVAAPAPAEPARPAAGLEAVLGNGRVPRIPPGAGPALVAQMAAVLERQAGGRRGQAASAAALPPGADGAGAVAHAARSCITMSLLLTHTWH